MKNTALFLACLPAFLAGSVSAQVKVEVSVPDAQYLAAEALPVKVRIVNDSGQTLNFGEENWLTYSVEARDGSIVIKSGEAPISHHLDVKPSQWAATTTDIAPYFDVVRPGRYSVTATVYIKDWSQKITSTPKYFDIVSGVPIWEQDIGVPQPLDNHNAPEVRKYYLQQVNLETSMKLYFRLTDALGSRTLKVFPIGPMISFSDPQTHVDQESNLHLLYQSSARTYSYSMIAPDGSLKVRQTYLYVNTAPHLRVDDAGNVVIVGGVRQLAENDLPTARKASYTNEIHAPVTPTH